MNAQMYVWNRFGCILLEKIESDGRTNSWGLKTILGVASGYSQLLYKVETLDVNKHVHLGVGGVR